MERHLVSKELYGALEMITGAFKNDFDAIIDYAVRYRFYGELEILNELKLKRLSEYLINGYEKESDSSE